MFANAKVVTRSTQASLSLVAIVDTYCGRYRYLWDSSGSLWYRLCQIKRRLGFKLLSLSSAWYIWAESLSLAYRGVWLWLPIPCWDCTSYHIIWSWEAYRWCCSYCTLLECLLTFDKWFFSKCCSLSEVGSFSAVLRILSLRVVASPSTTHCSWCRISSYCMLREHCILWNERLRIIIICSHTCSIIRHAKLTFLRLGASSLALLIRDHRLSSTRS